MIGVIATLKIKEGSGKDFEEVACKLVEKLLICTDLVTMVVQTL